MRKPLLGRQPEAQAEIDLTPMLDVTFIMLIFFIVTASFVREPGVEVQRPEAITAESLGSNAVLVAITADNDVWIDHKQVEPLQLRAAIDRLLAENPQSIAIIQADKAASAASVARVIDAAKAAGVAAVSLAASE